MMKVSLHGLSGQPGALTIFVQYSVVDLFLLLYSYSSISEHSQSCTANRFMCYMQHNNLTVNDFNNDNIIKPKSLFWCLEEVKQSHSFTKLVEYMNKMIRYINDVSNKRLKLKFLRKKRRSIFTKCLNYDFMLHIKLHKMHANEEQAFQALSLKYRLKFKFKFKIWIQFPKTSTRLHPWSIGAGIIWEKKPLQPVSHISLCRANKK